MINYKPKSGDMEMWLICVAMGKDIALIDKMQKNEEDGSYPVIFSVGGIELDFNLVAKRIDESIDELVTSKAQKLLDERYEGLLKDIYDIQKRIENQKKRFEYEWELENEK